MKNQIINAIKSHIPSNIREGINKRNKALVNKYDIPLIVAEYYGQLSPLDLDDEQVLLKRDSFIQIFTEQFVDKISEHRGKATGIISIEQRGVVQGWVERLDVADTTKEVIAGIAELFEIAPKLVPVLGPIISGVLKLGLTAFDKIDRHKQKEESRTITNRIQDAFKGRIRLHAEELANELGRIYEYQIAALTDEGIEKAARYAAAKMLHACTNQKQTLKTPYEWILGLFDKKPFFLRNYDLTSDYPEYQKWNADKMFIEPGVRVEYNDNRVPYKFYSSKDSQVDRYGYRGSLIMFDNNSYYVAQFDNNNRIEDKISSSSHQVYRPVMRIARYPELENYLDFFKNNPIPISFNEYITKQFGEDGRNIIAVYRPADVVLKRDISGYIFDESDFNRLNISQSVLKKSSWKKSCLRFGDLSNLKKENVQDASFKGSILSGAQLQRSDLQTNDFIASDISFSNVKDTIFDNNLTLSLVKKQEGVDLTEARIGFDITQRIVKLERDRSRIEHKVAEMAAHQQINSKVMGYKKPVAFYYNRSELNTVVKKLESYSLLVLTGLPGSGKTQLARRYAQHFEQTNPNHLFIWELLSDTAENLILGYRQLGKALNIPEKDLNQVSKMEEMRDLISKHLQERNSQFLLIYDNLTLEAREACILGADQGHVVVTTQDGRFFKTISDDNNPLPTLSLQAGLDKEEAIRFLLQGKPDSLKTKDEHEEAEKLAKDLDCLPLGLAAAKLYMSNDMSISSYRKSLESECEEIQEYQEEQLKKQGDYKTTQEAAIRMVVKKSIERMPKVRLIVNICAFMQAESVPIVLFESAMQQVEHHPVTTVKRCIDSMEAFSIVKDKGGEDKLRYISIHRTTQRVILSMLTPEEKQVAFKQVLELVTRHFKKDVLFKEDMELNQLLLPHVERLINDCRRDQEARIVLARLLNVKAYLYTQLGWGAKNAISFSQEAKVICDKLAGIDDRLSISQVYETLKKAGQEIDQDLTLLYASILYTYGRMYLYNASPAFKEEAISILKRGHSLSKYIEEREKKKVFLSVLTERNGLLPIITKEPTYKELRYAEERYKALLEDTGEYIDEEGSVKNLATDSFHKLMCSRNLITVYQELAKISKGEEKSAYYKQAEIHMERMCKLMDAEPKEKARISTFYNKIGELLVDKDNPNRNLQRAKGYFKKSCFIEEAKNNGKGLMDYTLADAHKGLALIYQEQREVSLAKGHSKRCLEIRKQMHEGQPEHSSLTDAKKLYDSLSKPGHLGSKPVFTHWRDYVEHRKAERKDESFEISYV